ncbi:hypothetical protein V6R21_17760 [Limibacter armeniacum]|uniref:hypothetical protein n=1 Tax=Limibacter armeniacum TaxID=466084 RepID=UPI002FE6B704
MKHKTHWVFELKNRTDLLLFMLRQTSGFALMIGLMAFVQAISIAIFFASIFESKISSQLEAMGMDNSSMLMHTLSILLGLCAGLVIEAGSFFFAINGMQKSSYFSAFVSGCLSIASYHAILYSEQINELLIFGIGVLGFFPSLFIMIASHELAKRVEKENFEQMMSKYKRQESEPEATEPTPKKVPEASTNSQFEILKSKINRQA